MTTRIVQRARALPRWAAWMSYAVAVLCLSGFWSMGMASAAFGLWLLGAVIALLRAARRTRPAPAGPGQDGIGSGGRAHASARRQRLTASRRRLVWR